MQITLKANDEAPAYVDLKINDVALQDDVNTHKYYKRQLESYDFREIANFEDSLYYVFTRMELEAKRIELEDKLSCRGLMHYNDYVGILNILKQLNYIDEDDRGN